MVGIPTVGLGIHRFGVQRSFCCGAGVARCTAGGRSSLLRSRAALAIALGELKRTSSHSYRALARLIDRPVATLHGWITATHLPHSGDTEAFRSLLDLLGAGDVDELVDAVALLRTERHASLENPYKGLNSFTESDAGLFFGREALVEELLSRVMGDLAQRRGHPVIVVGSSGAGKTSILRAGLLAGLREHADSVGVRYRTPSDGSLLYDLSTASRIGRRKQVVIVDQFEELFGSEHEDHLEDVTRAMEAHCQRDGGVLVLGVRSDFFERASEVPLVLEGLQDDPVVVGPMRTAEMTRAIIEPAERCSLSLTPELLVQLLHADFGVDSPFTSNPLPLVSHVLRLMVERCRDRELTLEAYESAGGLTAAIERSAEEAFLSSGGDEAACRLLFGQLVDVDRSAQPVRRRCELSTLEGLEPSVDFLGIVAEFAQRRLLTTDFGSVGITHEALIRSWPRLYEWIEGERAAILAVNRYKVIVAGWDDTGRSSDGLLRGTQLSLAEELLDTAGVVARMSQADLEFLVASQTLETQRQAERQEMRSVHVAAQAEVLRGSDASLSAQLAVVGYETSQTVEARSALLAATAPLPFSRWLGSSGPTVLAASEGIVAYNNADDCVRVIDLRSGADYRMRLRLGESEAISSIALSRNGQLLVAGTTNGEVTSWALGEQTEPAHQQRHRLSERSPVTALVFDAAGERLFAAAGLSVSELASAGLRKRGYSGTAPVLALSMDRGDRVLAVSRRDGSVDLWDLCETGTPLWRYIAESNGPAAAVAVAPDASMLVAGFHNGYVRAWSLDLDALEIRERAGESEAFASWVNGVDFSPCGGLVAAASSDGSVRVWDSVDWSRSHHDLEHPTVVTAVQFVDESTVASAAEDGTMRVWDVSLLRRAPAADTIWSVAFDRSGRRRVTASRSRVGISEIDCNGVVERHSTFEPPISLEFSGAAALSPDGEVVAVGTRAGHVLLLREATGEVIAELDGLAALVENLDFSPNGSLLCAVDHDGAVQVWSVSGSRTEALGQGRVERPAMCPAFSADSNLLAVTSESGCTSLFDLSGPEVVLAAEVRTGVSFALGAAFHPSRPILAVGNADRTVTLWDCESAQAPKLIERLTGPLGHTITVGFDTSGDLLAAGTTDGVLWIWDVADVERPRLHARLRSPERGVYALAFAPGRRVITAAGPHHRITTWQVDERAAVERVRAMAGDPITTDEWDLYLSPIVGARRSHPTE